jgi:hypothetical protein
MQQTHWFMGLKLATTGTHILGFMLLFCCFVETDCRQANAKAQEAVGHMTSFPSGREEISLPESNYRPLPRDSGVSPPPSDSLGLFWTNIY